MISATPRQWEKDDSLFFEGEEFRSTLVLKEYLHQRTDADDSTITVEQQRCFDFVIQLTSLMSQLRFCAEDWYRNHVGVACNRQHELPLPEDEMGRILLGADDDSPDQQIITRIAQNELPLLKSLMDGMRRVLRRERQMVSVGNAQQLDAYCLRWLTRQPGRTAAEKAGIRQRIMAVVREESLDTLENRVLKDFVKKCQWACWNYLRQFSAKRYSNSQRIKDVKSLQSLCQEFLKRSEIVAIPELAGMPFPNYVLRCDKRYSRMWEYYQQLVKQTRMVELVWPYRHKLFFECAIAMTLCKIEELARKKVRSFFGKDYWLHSFPRNGTFINKPRWGNLFVERQQLGEARMVVCESEMQMRQPFCCESAIKVHFLHSAKEQKDMEFTCIYLFIPANGPATVRLPVTSGATLNVIYTEKSSCQVMCEGNCSCLRVNSLSELRRELAKLDNILRRCL